MMDETKHGSLVAGAGSRNAGPASKARVFKRRIDCAPSAVGEDHDVRAEAATPARQTPGARGAAGDDRSPPRAF